jgi:hypothetical protein
MRMKRVLCWLSLTAYALLTLAFGSASQAEDFGVAYTVEEKTFKRFARSDDVLVFELFSNSNCTSLLHSEVLFAGDEVLVVDSVKRLRVRGSTRPPRMAVLRTNLDVVSPFAPVYLRVTGSAVVGLGGDCQIQMGAVMGSPGPQGPEGAAGPTGPAAAESVYTAKNTETSDGICSPMVIEVWCDAGDVLLGGGCWGTADQWYFRVNSRRPGDEGWTCRPVRNRANSCVPTTVTASAICSDITP